MDEAEALSRTHPDKEVRAWAMILHLSQFAGYLVPLAGFVAPIVIWRVKRDSMPEIDAHGRVVANWVISQVIYFALAFVLVFVLIGIPLLFVLGIVAVVFPIIGAVKASDGIVWKYPFSLPIF